MTWANEDLVLGRRCSSADVVLESMSNWVDIRAGELFGAGAVVGRGVVVRLLNVVEQPDEFRERAAFSIGAAVKNFFPNPMDSTSREIRPTEKGERTSNVIGLGDQAEGLIAESATADEEVRQSTTRTRGHL